MLRHFGVPVESTPLADGGLRVALVGEVDLTAADITVPADPSSAAFLAVAALITEGSDITLMNVGTNPLRFGLFETLAEMGGDITGLTHAPKGASLWLICAFALRGCMVLMCRLNVPPA